MRRLRRMAAAFLIISGTAFATTYAVQKLDTDLDQYSKPLKPTTVLWLQKLPLKSITAAWSWLGNRTVPDSLREPTYRSYCYLFDCDVEEASEPLSKYASLHEFFSRSLKPGLRPFEKSTFISCPSDGTIVNYGHVLDNTIEQVKGVSWNLSELIPSVDLAYFQEKISSEESLFFVTTYLAPGDYHNFHAPSDWHILHYRYHSGTLLPVAPFFMKRVPGLFALNESVTLSGKWKYGPMILTAVGALNVGGIHLEHSMLRVNSPSTLDDCAVEWNLNVGDMIGGFRFGSALLLIFAAPNNFEFSIIRGKKVRCGQPIGYVRKTKTDRK
eukprot:jgi/Galph1/2268/GphlegSOOS_G930.1